MSAGNGRGSAGTTAVGSKDVTITKGDILIIPAGTPHKWEDAEEFTSYVVVRVNPDGVAPLMELGTAKFGAQDYEAPSQTGERLGCGFAG